MIVRRRRAMKKWISTEHLGSNTINGSSKKNLRVSAAVSVVYRRRKLRRGELKKQEEENI